MLLSILERQNFCVFERKYWRSKSILPYLKKSVPKIQKGGKTPKSPSFFLLIFLSPSLASYLI